MAVERTSAETFDEFEGKVMVVAVEESTIPNSDTKRSQYHIQINPLNVEVGGKTGQMHEWIGISPKATDTSCPEGSVLDKYMQQIEIVLDKEVKDMNSHKEVMEALMNKTFLFKRMKHGKAFEGKEARNYWTPVKLVKSE